MAYKSSFYKLSNILSNLNTSFYMNNEDSKYKEFFTGLQKHNSKFLTSLIFY